MKHASAIYFGVDRIQHTVKRLLVVIGIVHNGQ